MMREWDSLRFVLEIARHGGLSGAARALGVTHATVSRQLDKAEAQAGLRLFSRWATGLVPTEAGREAVARATAIEAEVQGFDLAMAARDESETGPLILTVASLLMNSGVADDLQRFSKTHPGVSLTVLASDTALDLHRREADIALRVSHKPAESLWGRRVAQQKAGWYASGDFIERHPDPGRGPIPIISFRSWNRPVPTSLAALVPDAVPAIYCDDMISAVALARSGMAMLRMPHFLAQTFPDLVPVPGLPSAKYMPIWCLTHPDLRHVPRVLALMRHLAEGFAERRALYEGEG